MYSHVFLIIYFLYTYACTNISDFKLTIDVNSPGQKLPEFWKSTGLCPLATRSNVSKYLLTKDEKINLALIGSLPNHAIKQVRIHWLLDLITIRSINTNGTIQYNFEYLDTILDWLHMYRLRPGFELMGNPSSYYTDFLNLEQKAKWLSLIQDIVLRYIERYSVKYVSKWRFETMNEPDLKSYNIFNFTLPGYLSYVSASLEGFQEASRRRKQSSFKVGGPAGLFKSQDKHSLCWGLISECNKSPNCPLHFISFHKKGDATAAGVLNKGLQLMNYIHQHFPNLKKIPIANTEADILTGWSKSQDWRGDTRYAAMVVKVIIDHYKTFIQQMGINIEVLSNDNAFLNYHPYYFTQRTLLTRFQMNNTNPPHLQFIKKPVYVTMALLSFLGDTALNIPNKKQNTSLVSYLVTTSQRKNISEISILLSYVNDTKEDLTENGVIKIYVSIKNLPAKDYKYVIYTMDNLNNNPYAMWKKAGSPTFPNKTVREEMRRVEGPQKDDPSDFPSLGIGLATSLPSVILIHLCSRVEYSPGPVTNLQVLNVTYNEVMLIWKSRKVGTKCVRTYEIEFQPDDSGNEIDNQLFTRVNSHDVIFLWYQYVPSGPVQGEITRGIYRVRAVDYWDRPGQYSPTVRFPNLNKSTK